MTTHPFCKLETGKGATFVVTPCPGTQGVALFSSIKQLKEQGVSAVLTIMSDQELIQSGACDLEAVCESTQVKWLQLSVPSGSSLDDEFQSIVQNQIPNIMAAISGGKVIAIHSKGGSGRTRFVIGLLLVELGMSKEEAGMLVKSVSGPSSHLSY
ncbi:hypothetical protein [Pseudoalteromonas luteoviolacea]|uniref:Tyrosine specific protein phosphatases domain-containing protein n=1 Tax=Pseudoalteromonas luteoviolacea DSM 6061 TaxID=1365250 RepID=A0A161ZTA7_9GAMM|nr:hypothetical protein [Pseudoalteromonas luteoviolacea]KZN31749.1 hypothetical protein N475_04640 [Pseudoalteromonas luteoviolacea DSM 6061]KZN54609.1 hypothetical protein N474_02460 [Pseudoalteromonas luteoviolacea CPMOR-2]MBE0389086.1 hypothetical protein [Pseudoalteromonas luteoviolacea DSM 6061]TQF70439.1 protein phosphatase [Pseudoalteromonas luteoviolacea]